MGGVVHHQIADAAMAGADVAQDEAERRLAEDEAHLRVAIAVAQRRLGKADRDGGVERVVILAGAGAGDRVAGKIGGGAVGHGDADRARLAVRVRHDRQRIAMAIDRRERSGGATADGDVIGGKAGYILAEGEGEHHCAASIVGDGGRFVIGDRQGRRLGVDRIIGARPAGACVACQIGIARPYRHDIRAVLDIRGGREGRRPDLAVRAAGEGRKRSVVRRHIAIVEAGHRFGEGDRHRRRVPDLQRRVAHRHGDKLRADYIGASVEVPNIDGFDLGNLQVERLELINGRPGLAGIGVLLRGNPDILDIVDLCADRRVGKLRRAQPDLQLVHISDILRAQLGRARSAVIIVVARIARAARGAHIGAAGNGAAGIAGPAEPLIFECLVD